MSWGKRCKGARRGVSRSVGVVIGSALIIGACAGQEIESAIELPLPAYLPDCVDQYADGMIIDYSVEGDFSKACLEEGEMVSPVPVSLTCSDNRRLLFNLYAWGFQGEAMTVFDPPGNHRLEENDELQELVVICLRSDVDPDDDPDQDADS